MAVRKGTFKVANPGTGAMDEVMLKTNVEQVEGLADNTANAINKSLDEFLVGMIFPYAGKDIPAGFLLCNGAAISRTTYARLFAKIGTLYGTGDGSTTFNLPNLIERFVEGGDSSTAGRYLEPGIPNITGSITFERAGLNSSNMGGTGCFRKTAKAVTNSYAWTWDNEIAQGAAIISLNAGLSNVIYGRSSTIQPSSLQCQYFIKY